MGKLWAGEIRLSVQYLAMSGDMSAGTGSELMFSFVQYSQQFKARKSRRLHNAQ